MPKNKPRNAFFFFMLECKRSGEADGQTFSNGLKDVQNCPQVNAKWESLTKEQRRPYEEMGKKDKKDKKDTQKPVEKKTTYGESIDALDEKKRKEKEFEKAMQENIKITVDRAVNLNILPKIKFCFMHVNHFFSIIINNRCEYFPAEYALGIFSLENGIESVHHVIVSSKIPLGYRREAMETSQNSHQIPVEHTGGETDFSVMYTKLIDFLESRKCLDQYPPIYTLNKHVLIVRSVLAKLSNEANQDKKKFKVYDLESLFIHIANEAFKAREDRTMKFIPAYAYRIFKSIAYISEKGFECSFHKYVETGSEYCSKSKLQQWAWILCDEFCPPLEVDMHPGVHCPLKTDPNLMTHMMGDLNITDNYRSEPECSSMLSMTGVSEQHRWRASSRTHQDEVRRRNESQPVTVIDYSKMSGTTNVLDKSNNESQHKYEEEDTYDDESSRRKLLHLLNRRRKQPQSCNSSINSNSETVEASIPTVEEKRSFPSIGGRGILYQNDELAVRKWNLSKGRGKPI